MKQPKEVARLFLDYAEDCVAIIFLKRKRISWEQSKHAPNNPFNFHVDALCSARVIQALGRSLEGVAQGLPNKSLDPTRDRTVLSSSVTAM
jgi:hypothetical protein